MHILGQLETPPPQKNAPPREISLLHHDLLECQENLQPHQSSQ